jgi:hypothetical protein
MAQYWAAKVRAAGQVRYSRLEHGIQHVLVRHPDRCVVLPGFRLSIFLMHDSRQPHRDAAAIDLKPPAGGNPADSASLNALTSSTPDRTPIYRGSRAAKQP